MDEFESRLSGDLSGASVGVGAGAGLESAVKKKVRRRQAAAAIAAAVPVLFLLVGAVWLVNLSDNDGAAELETVDNPAPGPGEDSVTPTSDPLRAALIALGAAVDTAPTEAVELGNSTWCGIDQRTQDASPTTQGEAARRCFFDAAGSDSNGVLVVVGPSMEGDPIVEVLRSTSGDLLQLIDTTRDSFGQGGWTVESCLVIDGSIGGAEVFVLTGCGDIPPEEPVRTSLHRALLDLGVVLDSAPIEAITLGGAEWCGVDTFEGGRTGAGNQDARRCLLDAWDNRTPAVIVYDLAAIEDSLVEVQRMSEMGYVIRWIVNSPEVDDFGPWSVWYCTEMDRSAAGVEPIFAGANDCNNSLPGGQADASAGDPRATEDLGPDLALAPGESATFAVDGVTWHESLDDTREIFILPILDGRPSRRPWSGAGTASLNANGGVTVDLTVPLLVGSFDRSEFPTAEFSLLTAGAYEVLIDSVVLATLTVTADAVDDGSAFEPPTGVDPSRALLRPDGLGDVSFGGSRASVIPALEELFGATATYLPFEGCVTTGYAQFSNGVIIEFWGDSAGSETGFAAWYYGYEIREFGFPEAPVGGAILGGDLTTPTGVTLGTAFGEVEATGGGASGGYDTGWGAGIWFENINIAGELTRDATSPLAQVATIAGGRRGSPARMVC